MEMAIEKEISQEEMETRRPWDELCPELLDSIYGKLPSHLERTEFGSVCKNWRRTYTSAADYSPPRASHTADFTICTFRTGSTITTSYPQEIPDRLRADFAGASVIGRDESGGGDSGEWWLMSNSAGKIFCCFNPLLRSNNVIELPRLSWSDVNKSKRAETKVRTRAAFSAPPTDPNSMILVVHGGGGCYTTFSTLLRRDGWWSNYKIMFGAERICAGIGYKEGTFWCLFDTGEVLIYEIDGGDGDDLMRKRTVIMMGAASPLSPERFRGINYLCTAVKFDGGEGGFEVASWERVRRGLSRKFRLVTVERETAAAAEELEGGTTSFEERDGSMRVILVLDQLGMMWKLTNFHIIDLKGSIISL